MQHLVLPVSPLQVAAAFVRRDFLVAASYKTAFVADLVGIVFKVITFYYIGAAFQGGMTDSLAAFGHGYFAFLIIGIALTDFVHTSLDTFATSVRDSQMTGTLEVVLLSPIRMAEMVVYSSLWPYIFTAVRFAAYIGCGWAVFGLPITVSGIPSAVAFLVLTILCFAPLGILSAAVIMVFKKGAWFQTFISASGVLLGGVAYPRSVLPGWAAQLGQYLPLTHAVNAMRETLLNGKGMLDLRQETAFLVLFAAAATPVSLWVFQRAVAHAKRMGTLTQY